MNRKFLTLMLFLCWLGVFAQRGKHGAKTVSATNIIYNEYTTLAANANAGDNTITVAASSLNTNGRFPAALASGDLIMIIQMQGATLLGSSDPGTPYLGLPNDSTWGQVVSYNNCGLHELAEVFSVPNSTTIQLSCALQNNYTALGKVQIVRVPRITDLTVTSSGELTCPTWNGSTGGVLALEVLTNTVINNGGKISVTGKGFRGGQLSGDDVANVFMYTSKNSDCGGEKGEGIGGYQADYDQFGGRYSRGAAANGGGGGNGWNCGGGGGGNGGNFSSWTGNGNPDNSNSTWASAWNLEYGNFSSSTSSGGGKGGYGWSASNANALTTGPGNGSWNGGFRRNNGGLGGRPVDNSSNRLFLGGGGGAGDQDNTQGGIGGNGGGLIYVMNYGTITGSGSAIISANGNNGNNSSGTASSGGYAGKDGGGGAGAGGSVILNSVGTISGIVVDASGGNGGNQILTRGSFYFGSLNEAEGPGGGGGGGYINSSSGGYTQLVAGGLNGTTNSEGVTEFIPNGATKGGSGKIEQTVTNFTLYAEDDTICGGNTATLTANINGNPPSGIILTWYDSKSGGNVLSTGSTFTTPVLTSDTTFYVGSCPGTYRLAVNVKVISDLNILVSGSPTSICPGGSSNLTASGADTYLWSPVSTLNISAGSTVVASPTSTTTYTVTGTANSCTDTASVVVEVMSAINVNVSATPSTICTGESSSLNATGASSYTWSPSSGLNQTTGNSVSANPNVTTTYTIIGTTGSCTDTAQFILSVQSIPSITGTASVSTICSGDSKILTVSGATQYTWTPESSLSSTTGGSVIATPTTTTTYTVTGTTTNCSSTREIIVNVDPQIDVLVTPASSTVCQNGSAVLVSSGATNYTWSPGAELSSTSGSTVTATPASTSTYTVAGTSGACSDTAIAIVNVAATINVISSASPSTICAGGITNLLATGASNYSWDPSSSLSTTTGANVTANPSVTETYTVTGSSGSCSDTGIVIVNVNSGITVTANTANSSICQGNSTVLTASGATTYSWSPAANLSSGTGASVDANPVTTTTYTVTGTSGTCKDESIVIVNVDNPITVSTLASPEAICTGASSNLIASGATTYQWTPGTSLSGTVGESVTASPAVTSTYTVTGITGTCSSIDTVIIKVNSINVSIAASANSICEGQSADMVASGADSYSWSPATNLSSTNSASVIASPPTTTTYTVIGTSANCSQETVLIINVSPSIIVNVNSSSLTICSGSSALLEANGATVYSWSPSSTLNNNNSASVTASPSVTTTYTVTGTSGACVNSNSVIVEVLPELSISLIANETVVCNGASTIISASGADTYQWQPASSLSATTGNTITATPTSTISYTVTGTQGACVDEAEILITVTNINLTVSASESQICAGSSSVLQANGASTYEWSPTTTLSSASGSGTQASPLLTTTYTVTGSNGSCAKVSEVVVEVINSPDLANAGNDQTICGDETNLNGIVPTFGTGSWSLLSGGGLFSDASSATSFISGLSVGVNVLEWRVDNACGTTSDQVTIVSSGSPDINAGADVSIVSGSSTMLQATSNGSSYQWTPVTSLNNPSVLNPTASPVATTTYTLLVTNNNGCISTDFVVVSVEYENVIFVPDIFSPNQDGQNDILFVRGKNIVELDFILYDRWGEKVFQTSSTTNGWDGTFRGAPMNSAVFVYYLKAKFSNGETINEKGNISLIR